MTLLRFYLLLVVVLGGAAWGQNEAALRERWLVSSVKEVPALLAGLTERLTTVDAATRWLTPPKPPVLTGGFHRLVSPATTDPIGVLIIPKRQPKRAWPLAVVDQPSGGPVDPADELALRMRYAGYLELGYAVFHPERRVFRHEGAPSDLANQLAALRDVFPFDDERVLLLTHTGARFAGKAPVPAYRGDVTPLAGVLQLFTPWLSATPLTQPGPWAGRWVLCLRSTNVADSARLYGLRLAEWERDGVLHQLQVEDAAFDLPDFATIDEELLRRPLASLRRDPPSERFKVSLGGDHALRHEWVELVEGQNAVEITAKRDGDMVSLLRGGADTAVVALNLYLPFEMESPRVLFNGREVASGSRVMGVAETLLAARHRAQTGRVARCVIKLR